MSTSDVTPSGERPVRNTASLKSVLRWLGIPLFIFVIVFLGYYLSSNQLWSVAAPIDWYKHDVYQAEAFLHGSLDLKKAGVPDFYQDLVNNKDGTRYLPYQPVPAILLMPAVALWGTDFKEYYASMVIGAINVVLFWYLLNELKVNWKTKALMLPFFAFGTVNFYCASTGTLWFYTHVVAVMFLLLAIIFLLRRVNPLIPAFFLGCAFMSRQPTILAAPFFAYWMIRQRYPSVFTMDTVRALARDRKMLTQIGMFIGMLIPFVALAGWYNAARFGNPLDTGLSDLYNQYGGVAYTFYLRDFPQAVRFSAFDLRNVPLHLYTIFLLPPKFTGGLDIFRPETYGMSVLLTSPPFVYAFLARRNDPLKVACWIAIPLVAIPTLAYYSQGWVQYGYRYLMDYIPFLLILTAIGFDDNQSPTSLRIMTVLVAVSVVAGFWGRYWGTHLGW